MSVRNHRPAFATLLVEHRAAANLTLATLAESIELTSSAISQVEGPPYKIPHATNVLKLADALKITGKQRAEFIRVATVERIFNRAGASKVKTLPSHLTSFVGRESDLIEIAGDLLHNRLVTLTGCGGIGKSRMAVEVAHRLSDEWKDGAWFVDLSSVNPNDGSSIVERVAARLEIRLAGAGSPGELSTAIGRRRLILVIDNCEHLIGPVRHVIDSIISGCPAVSVLATSRERLGITGETVYRIAGLPVPKERQPGNAADARDFGAVELFEDRASSVVHDFALTDFNAAAVGGICRRLDGIPLAIELAAARMGSLPLDELCRQLERHFTVIASGRDDLPLRQRTLNATIAWSHDLLSEFERIVFRRLAVFSDGWTFAAAEAVCADALLPTPLVLDALTSLVEKSLIEFLAAGDLARYQMLAVTREFAAERLQAAGEMDATMERHLHYFVTRFESAGREFMLTYREAVVRALKPELANARKALDWAMAHGHDRLAARLFAATPLWQSCGLHHEAMTRAKAVIATNDEDAELSPRLWMQVANAAMNMGESERSYAAALHAARLARPSDEPRLRAVAFARLAVHAARTLRFDEATSAITFAQEAMAEIERTGDTARLPAAFLWEARGYLAMLQGDHSSAAIEFERTRSLCRSVGYHAMEILMTINLAEIDHARGRTSRAIAELREMLDAGKPIARKDLHAGALINLAGFSAALDDTAGAKDAARRGIVMLAETGPDPFIAVAIEHLALALAIESQWERAARLAGYSDACITAAGGKREYAEQTTYDRLHRLLGERFAPADLARRRTEGTLLTRDQAIVDALAACQPLQTTQSSALLKRPGRVRRRG